MDSIPFAVSTVQLDSGNQIYALILAQQDVPGPLSSPSVDLLRHSTSAPAHGFILGFAANGINAFCIGSESECLPIELLNQAGGLEVFVVDNDGQVINGRRLTFC